MMALPVPTKLVVLSLYLMALAGCAEVARPVSEGAKGPNLTAGQIDRVGRRIWQNECGGTVAGLTSWNAGEAFASLGIGHFIWYPAGQNGPFEESFPPLVAFLEARGISMPTWTKGACPWPSKAAFEADKNGPRQTELRNVLSRTVRQQTEFIMARMERALPKMLAQSSNPEGVRRAFDGLKQTGEGAFCLIDYVNFKGEGTNPKERYQGQGWGLLQVLEGMPKSKIVWQQPGQFAESAKRVLSRRVANSPSERGEQRWLAGWHKRCEAYKRPL